MTSILLVDDERWVRTALRKVIERTRIQCEVVKECANGLEALDWLESNRADVIMTDVKMPVMDGLTLVKQLRERAKPPEVVMISGYDDFQYVQFALRQQVVDYLLKPVEADDLSKCLETIQARIAADKAVDPPATIMQEDRQETPIQQAVRYIHAALPGDVTLQDVAAKVHLNPSYLSQLFKQQMKMNFIDYVLEQRMAKATQLLAQTSLRVSEIAERVGYSDVAYFSNTYKRITGMTPSEYRRSGMS